MIKHSSTLVSGVLAFLAYFTIIALLIFYFNTRDEMKKEHFVKKNEHRIQVALSSPKKVTAPKATNKKKSVKKQTSKPKQPTKPKKKPASQKKVIKEKVVKKKLVKKKPPKKTKPKKQARDLFKNVKTSKKKQLDIKVTDKPIKTKPKSDLIKVSSMSASERINASLQSNQKKSDKGVENAYFAHVQRMLEDWPAQSNYAGEKATVILTIQPSGYFEFRIISQSNIPDFNQGLREFLEQLQEIGFGPHHAGRPYRFEAEFIAKD